MEKSKSKFGQKSTQYKKPRGLVRKEINGMENPEYKDVLAVDPKIEDQEWTVVSFIDPDDGIMENKNIYYFYDFIKAWEYEKTITRFVEFMGFLSQKHRLKLDIMMEDFKEFAQDQKHIISKSSLLDDYKNHIDAHGERLQKEFDEANNFQTNVRGFKVRGNFADKKHAEARACLMREFEEAHDVHVMPVGVWAPFHADAYRTKQVEYLEEELNQLMTKKMENQALADKAFDQRVFDAKKNAMDKNIAQAEKTGNVLTQTMTEEGKLVQVNTMKPAFGPVDEPISTSSLIDNLFGNSNIEVSKKEEPAIEFFDL